MSEMINSYVEGLEDDEEGERGRQRTKERPC